MKRYRFLRFAAGILRILAWLTLIVGVAVCVYALLCEFVIEDMPELPAISEFGTIPAVVFIFIHCLLFFLFWYAVAEVIYVFLDIEENTRRCADSMAKKP